MATVLLVEDDDAIRGLLARVLERDGHAVTKACHGGEAISHLTDVAFDLMVLDLMMPVASGSEVLTFMRRSGRMTPTVIITAVHDLALVRLDLSGVLHVLRKPFDMEVLRHTVNACLPISPPEVDPAGLSDAPSLT